MATTSGASTTATSSVAAIGMARQFGVDGVGAADERDRDARVPGRGQRAVHDRTRRVVAAHGVDGDAAAARGDRSRGAPRRR